MQDSSSHSRGGYLPNLRVSTISYNNISWDNPNVARRVEIPSSDLYRNQFEGVIPSTINGLGGFKVIDNSSKIHDELNILHQRMELY